jgi:hypothetical protein
MSNTAMHQSRLHSLFDLLPVSLRPGDGERSDDQKLDQDPVVLLDSKICQPFMGVAAPGPRRA